MFRIIALRFAGAMVSVLAGLCLVVSVLSLVAWAKGGSAADGTPVLASGFFVGFLVCVLVFLLLRRQSTRTEAQVEALIDDQPVDGQD